MNVAEEPAFNGSEERETMKIILYQCMPVSEGDDDDDDDDDEDESDQSKFST